MQPSLVTVPCATHTAWFPEDGSSKTALVKNIVLVYFMLCFSVRVHISNIKVTSLGHKHSFATPKSWGPLTRPQKGHTRHPRLNGASPICAWL